jgi:GAF domain-containing protein
MDASQHGGCQISDLSSGLAELANLMLASPSVDRLLTGAARLGASVVIPAASCGVTVRLGTGPATVITCGPLASDADEARHGEDEGPCRHTLRTGEAVLVPDLVIDERWPDYRYRALGRGVRSSLSLPLRADGDTRGAVNLYATVPAAFGHAAQQRAELFVGQVSTALTLVIRQAQQAELTGQLRSALAGRTVIDQAIGILIDRQRCDAEDAFDLLRGASQHQNRKLHDIATDIVRTVSGGEPRPGPFRYPR